MGTGYTRNDTTNNIADGNIIDAADLDGEFDAIQSAFNNTTGHTHDGTSSEGAPITVTGPAQEYVSTGTELRPKTNNTYDLGSLALQWKNLYVDGTGYIDTLSADAATVNGNITVTGTVDGRDIATDGAKLDGIEAGADVTDTVNVTAAGALMDSELTNITAVKALNQGVATTDSPSFAAATINGNITVTGTVDGRDIAADGTKLDGIESGATADQTAAEIRALVEAATDSNVFTDADHTKLNGIEASADVTDTANVTAAGALMDSELTNITAVKALNQGVATTDSPTFAGLTTTADVSFGDNDKAIFGAGSDLQIYHDGSDSFILDNGAGNLAIRGSSSIFLQSPTGETYLQATNNGAVSLFYDNAIKLATTATGVDVTGNIAVSGTVDGRDVAVDGSKLDGIESGATADQTITAGSGLSGGGTGNVTLSHADTSSQSSVNNSNNTVIQDVTVDTYGHVTGLASKTIVAPTVNGTSGQVLTSNGTSTPTWADPAGGFALSSVSGTTQALDVGTYNFFDAGTLTADTTLTFSSVPTEAKWYYTANIGIAATYDISAGRYTGSSYLYVSETGNLAEYGVSFKPDGTKMYVLAGTIAFQYTLSTAWDLSTTSYDSVSFNFSSRDSSPVALFFKPDGTKMYMTGFTNKRVYQYSLSTAWDLSTASYDSVSFSVNSQGARPFGLDFKPDGTRMYTTERDSDTVYQYNLSTAWDVSTASYSGNSFNVSSQANVPYDAKFKPDGTKMYVLDAGGDFVYSYSLSTAWDVSTASYDDESFSVALQSAGPSSIYLKPDGYYLYLGGGTTNTVYEYSVVSGYSLTIPASVSNPPTLFTIGGDRITYEFYTADGGTNVYLIGEEIT
jgi:sugar lactone lactonase YvrE